MDEKSSGLILRTRLLTETSLIVHWLTPDLGRIATVAKGARRPKSPFRGKLDLFHVADLSFARSRRSDLHTLREVAIRETYPALRQDLQLLRQAAYGAQLLEQTTETETPLPGMFQLMLGLLTFLTTPQPGRPPEQERPLALSRSSAPGEAAGSRRAGDGRIPEFNVRSSPTNPVPVFAFEMKLLAVIGLQPDVAQCDLQAGTREILQQLAVADWTLLASLKLSAAQITELRQFLHGFLVYHLGRIPGGRATALH